MPLRYYSSSNVELTRNRAIETLSHHYGESGAIGRLLSFEGAAQRYGSYDCELNGRLILRVDRVAIAGEHDVCAALDEMFG